MTDGAADGADDDEGALDVDGAADALADGAAEGVAEGADEAALDVVRAVADERIAFEPADGVTLDASSPHDASATVATSAVVAARATRVGRRAQNGHTSPRCT